MRKWLPDLPEGSWKKVLGVTCEITLAVAALAVFGMMIGNELAGEPITSADYLTTIILVVLITPPVFAYLMIKLVQLHHVNQELHRYATTDSMTGALNRRAFLEHVEDRLAAPDSYLFASGAALFVIDVDHFKWINDRFGHQTGDLALTRIAEIIRVNLREGDIFGRLGGEEFGAYLEGLSVAAALEIAERCRMAIGTYRFCPDGVAHGVSISIGIAFPRPGDDLTSLYKAADDRLYIAKAEGRNRIEPKLRPRAA